MDEVIRAKDNTVTYLGNNNSVNNIRTGLPGINPETGAIIVNKLGTGSMELADDDLRLTEGPKLDSIWHLQLPKPLSPDLFELAKNRIEMFFEQNNLSGAGGERTPTGFNITLPASLANEFSSFIRISGAVLSKEGPSRKMRRAFNK